MTTALASTPTRTTESLGPPAPKRIIPTSTQTTSASGKNSDRPSASDKAHPAQKRVALNEVACPVCSVEIPQRNVNAHLDKCLKDQEHQQRQGVASSSGQSRSGRKPVQKIVYHLLKVKVICSSCLYVLFLKVGCEVARTHNFEMVQLRLGFIGKCSGFLVR